MKTVGTIFEIMNAFVNGDSGPHRNSNNSLYYRQYENQDTLYSYGKHFPLCDHFYPEHKIYNKPWDLYIINGDKYSATTRYHQKMILDSIKYGSNKEYITLSHLTLNNADINLIDSTIIDYTEDFHITVIDEKDIPIGATVNRDKHGNILFCHMAATVVLKYENKYFLCGMDEESYFISQLPKKVKTVNDAFKSLKPPAVKQAEKNGIPVKRQGEWFFITSYTDPKEALTFYKTMESNFILPSDTKNSNPHIATRGIIQKKRIYVSGSIRHTEHKTLKLSIAKNPVIYEAHRNTAINSWSAVGVD